MKILQIIPFFAPAWGFGGPVKVCFDISSELVKRGHSVTVATTDALDQKSRVKKIREEINGIKIIRFRNLSTRLSKGANLFLPLGFSRFLKNNIAGFDLVHLHAFFTYQNIISSNYCLKHNIPYILHLHESLVPRPLLGKVWIKRFFIFFFGRKILENAKLIYVVSASGKEDLAVFLPELRHKIKIVPNCVSGKRPSEILNMNRQKYGLKKTDKVILSLSRISFIKGIDLLLRALSELVKKDKGYKLIIAGPDEGGEMNRLELLVAELGLKDQVIFTGLVEGHKKEELFAISDLFALFSLYESFSITMLEALDHNLPVCLSKEVGVADEVLQFQCGVLIDQANDASSSSRQIEQAYKNRSMLKKNCHKALSLFDFSQTVTNIAKDYSEII